MDIELFSTILVIFSFKIKYYLNIVYFYFFEAYTSCENKCKATQNFAVIFKKNSKQEFGLIHKFFFLNNIIYCLIKKITKTISFSNDLNTETLLNNFYILGKLCKEFELINIKDIIAKCTYTNNDELYFLSKCCDLNEHD